MPSEAVSHGLSSSEALTLKVTKERFVSNHSGTNLTELCALVALVPVLASLFQQLLHRASSTVQGFGVRPLLQYACVVVPVILAVMSDSTLALLIAPVFVCAIVACFQICPAGIPGISQTLQRIAEQQRKSCVTSVRGATLLCTAVCILAVDFQAFPRRYCKAEKFGQGLMDLGVGSFVFSSGISVKPSSEHMPIYRAVPKALQHNAVLLMLGAARLCSVKTLDYQEHASEYGVHWNFFLTVAAVSILMTLLPIPYDYSLAAGGAVLCLHQLTLSNGLIDVVHADGRGPQLWHLNKEGLLSVPGYWALALLSKGLSSHLHPKVQTAGAEAKTAISSRQAWLWVMKLLIIAAVLWTAFLTVLKGVQPVSRRACNMSYVLLSLCTNWMMLLLFLFGSLLSMTAEPLDLLAACSQNMLPLFLVANVLTGAVNLSVNSLTVPNSQAICVVFAYMGVVCCTASVLWMNKLQIKPFSAANKAKMV